MFFPRAEAKVECGVRILHSHYFSELLHVPTLRPFAFPEHARAGAQRPAAQGDQAVARAERGPSRRKSAPGEERVRKSLPSRRARVPRGRTRRAPIRRPGALLASPNNLLQRTSALLR
jgi:hypothetical protein